MQRGQRIYHVVFDLARGRAFYTSRLHGSKKLFDIIMGKDPMMVLALETTYRADARRLARNINHFVRLHLRCDENGCWPEIQFSPTAESAQALSLHGLEVGVFRSVEWKASSRLPSRTNARIARSLHSRRRR